MFDDGRYSSHSVRPRSLNLNKILRILATTFIIALMPTQATAAKDAVAISEAVPEIFRDVIDCLKINEIEERLACYDHNVRAMETAQKSKKLFLASDGQIKESRRGLFGLTMPNLKIFGTGTDDAEEIKEITATIVSVRDTVNGYIFELEDGAIWAQSEIRYLGSMPKKRQKIKIRKAALGSFMGKLDNGVGFRIKRLNQ